jgi:hypothetical protein
MGNTPKKKTAKTATPSTPEVMAPPLGPTAASAWKGKARLDGQDLALPSGNVARVRNISPEAFFASGFMPDSLTNLVRESINKKAGVPPSKIKAIAEDPKKILEAMETFNRVLVYCVIEPAIETVPGCADTYGSEGEETECGKPQSDDIHHKDVVGKHRFKMARRDPDILYADEVDLNDKLFIFQWALGGVSNLEQFRDEQRALVESASDGKAVRRPAKRAAGRK